MFHVVRLEAYRRGSYENERDEPTLSAIGGGATDRRAAGNIYRTPSKSARTLALSLSVALPDLSRAIRHVSSAHHYAPVIKCRHTPVVCETHFRCFEVIICDP